MGPSDAASSANPAAELCADADGAWLTWERPAPSGDIRREPAYGVAITRGRTTVTLNRLSIARINAITAFAGGAGTGAAADAASPASRNKRPDFQNRICAGASLVLGRHMLAVPFWRVQALIPDFLIPGQTGSRVGGRRLGHRTRGESERGVLGGVARRVGLGRASLSNGVILLGRTGPGVPCREWTLHCFPAPGAEGVGARTNTKG